MYQYSLGWFEGLFTAAIDNTEKVDEIPERLAILRAYFTYSLYSNICRSLFEKVCLYLSSLSIVYLNKTTAERRFLNSQDKLVFSLLLTITIAVAEGRLEQSDVIFLLGGAQPRHILPNPVSFLSPQNWAEFNG